MIGLCFDAVELTLMLVATYAIYKISYVIYMRVASDIAARAMIHHTYNTIRLARFKLAVFTIGLMIILLSLLDHALSTAALLVGGAKGILGI